MSEKTSDNVHDFVNRLSDIEDDKDGFRIDDIYDDLSANEKLLVFIAKREERNRVFWLILKSIEDGGLDS